MDLPMMIRTSGVLVFFMLCIDMLTCADHHCVSRIIHCSKTLAKDMVEAGDREGICLATRDMLTCLEIGCNIYVSSCELSIARNTILTSLKYCGPYVTPIDENCLATTTTTDASSSSSASKLIFTSEKWMVLTFLTWLWPFRSLVIK
ncbi:unnamed protein product [Lymnaea stagnalis]|uniref:Uncharacterized protein n=1 Tax=Lymnaea stagnalis TaxID=6523 RepID=A0AAV2HKF5_LYMST